MMAPAKDFTLLNTYLEYATQKEELELTLYCEWEKHWHPTQHSVYRFRPEQEWFSPLKEKWGEFARITKRVAPLAGPAVGTAMKELAEKAEKLAGEKDVSSAFAKDLGLREESGLIDLEARHLLPRLIKQLDKKRGENHPEFGGLHPYHVKEDGRLLWLCAEHWKQYESTRSSTNVLNSPLREPNDFRQICIIPSNPGKHPRAPRSKS